MELENLKKRDQIIWLYKKIEEDFENKVTALLTNTKILPNREDYSVAPDFDNIKDWKIDTFITKTYSMEGESKEHEEILRIKGKLHITKFTIEMEPSFDFDFNAKKDTFSFNPSIVKSIIEKEQEKEKWSVYQLFGKGNSEYYKKLIVFDKEEEKIVEKLRKETAPLLKGFGFSEEEANTLTIAAIKHSSFTPDMTPEGLFGLALKIRGQALTN